ncbi:MBOAT family O-acyltransferase [Sphingomonas rubra]|uniref:Probable alginate O-acetylase AlgI n=1 Tax=Sphingomonas rubra TaxID=634430 RepID=A0A1I5RPQ7_9SPHN|nr:MBOAT family protein [Sphingomonas rubra]SFP60495.1 D-alanyl-lipoteichoic acid acyltransferase DltB, MBOAT superfamily [Sphingomonas rubra]
MLFPTLGFGLFFLLVYALAWALKASNEWRKIALLMASWFFYGAWDGRFVALLFGSAVVNWALARGIAASRSPRGARLLLTGGVVANLAVLGYFKYVGFFFEQLALLLHGLGFARDLPLMQVLLPVGVSFFTFQAISYLVDVHKRRVEAAGLLDLMLLMSFFPHLVAGPIVRASDLLPQFRATPRLERGAVAAALLLIVWGLFKKAVIASELAGSLVDPAFFDPASRSGLDLLVGAYGYAVQIYCDFSAYSDMAIGIALLLGYRFPRNFDQPYRARSLQDFWRRWHISLSSWLRDYLYIPLGGSRRGAAHTYVNLFLTMFLGGLWHGASWNFVIWGSLHGLWLGAERFWDRHRPAGIARAPGWAAWLVTFHIVVLGWVFFRAPDLDAALGYLGALGSGGWRNTLVTPLSLGLVLLGMAIHFVPPRLLPIAAVRLRGWPAPALGLALGALVLVVDAMRPEGVAPFIYYQF